MNTPVSIITSTAADATGQGVTDYQNAVAAHIGGDWGGHNQFCYYGTNAYAEPATGHTIANGKLMRVQLTGTNSDGTGDGVFAFPVIDTGATVTVIGNVPAILIQPADQTAAAGSTVIISVSVATATPETYQWKLDGVTIADAIYSVYVISSASAADMGSYSVVISNAYGSTTSANAVLTVT
jgi:predicted aspartyl protease